MATSSTLLHGLSPEEHEAMMRKVFREELAKINIQSPEASNYIEPPMSDRQARQFMGGEGKPISRQTFYTWRRKGIIKAHIINGRTYYFKSELIKSMK